MRARYSIPLLLSCSLLLAGCGDDKVKQAEADASDPALTGALADQIMVDPDLVNQNRGNAAVGGGGPASAEIPPIERTAEAVAAAKAEAAKLVGGAMESAPAPATGGAGNDGGPGDDGLAAVTAGQAAATVGGAGGVRCADKVEYSAGWAAKLPAAFPVYPRGHVQEAAGTDKDGCHLRVVNYLTPVPVADVVNFYYTRARSAGFEVEHRLDGKDHVVGGSSGTAAYVVYVRSAPGGLTDVDIIAQGG